MTREIQDDDLMHWQMDYAWRWFEHHAKQRMTMFHFFLIIVGVLATALVACLREGMSDMAYGIAALGIIACISSFFFDRRNREMTRYAEDLMEKVEERLFAGNNWCVNGKQLGCLLIERSSHMREGEESDRPWYLFLWKHKFWIHTMQGAAALGFLLAILFMSAFGNEVMGETKRQLQNDMWHLRLALAETKSASSNTHLHADINEIMHATRALHEDVVRVQQSLLDETEKREKKKLIEQLAVIHSDTQRILDLLNQKRLETGASTKGEE